VSREVIARGEDLDEMVFGLANAGVLVAAGDKKKKITCRRKEWVRPWKQNIS